MATKRTDSQTRADKQYDAKRAAPISVRLSPKELVELDAERGLLGRGAYLRRLFLERPIKESVPGAHNDQAKTEHIVKEQGEVHEPG